MISNRDRRAQHGVAMVEFAIALPLLLLLLLGVAEFGRMLFHYNSVLQASRDASRYAAAEAWNKTLGSIELTTALETAIKNVAVYGVPSANAGFSPVVPDLTTAQVAVTPVNSGSATDHVRVTITYTFQPVIDTLPQILGGQAISLGIPLVASSVMRAL